MKEIMLNITIFYESYGRKSGQCKPPANFYLVGLLPFMNKCLIMIDYSLIF